MRNVTMYVGIDAHKKDLFMAMFVGDQGTPVSWKKPNEPASGESCYRFWMTRPNT